MRAAERAAWASGAGETCNAGAGASSSSSGGSHSGSSGGDGASGVVGLSSVFCLADADVAGLAAAVAALAGDPPLRRSAHAKAAAAVPASGGGGGGGKGNGGGGVGAVLASASERLGVPALLDDAEFPHEEVCLLLLAELSARWNSNSHKGTKGVYPKRCLHDATGLVTAAAAACRFWRFYRRCLVACLARALVHA